MKQAILITAYKDPGHLKQIVDFFDSDFSFYIHIDKKSLISSSEMEELALLQNVKFVGKKYRVNWGGYNHLQAILFLSSIALEEPGNYFFHLISGSDFPIKSPEKFKDFFHVNRQKIFLNHFEVPFEGWANNGGLDRLQYYHLFDFWNFKIAKEKYRINRIINLQKKLGFKRTISARIPKLYGGSTWWSMSRDCLEYVMNFTSRNRHVLRRFKYTFCSEEFYFQTIVLNSGFNLKVNSDSLRYIDWVPRNGNNPAVLDDSDFNRLIASDAFFARKMENPISFNLIQNLKKFIKDSHQN